MLKLFLWFRYISRRKIVILSILAVALSAALLIVVSSLFGGFIRAVENSAVETLGDVVISPPTQFAGYAELERRLEELDSVEAASSSLSSYGLLYLGKGQVNAVSVRGLDIEKAGAVFDFKSHLVGNGAGEISDMDNGGFVGIAVLQQPDEETDEYDFEAVKESIGRSLVLTTGTAEDGSSDSFRRRVIQFNVSDVVYTGIYELDRGFIYLPIERIQDELYPGRQASADQVQIKLSSGADSESAVEEIRQVWEDFARAELGWSGFYLQQSEVVTSIEMQGRYIAAIRQQLGILLMIFGVVSLSVVILVFCIFYMIVSTKMKDIAIIKSCGGSGWSVLGIFLGFGGFVGVVGSVLGVFFGWLITININTIELLISRMFGFKIWKSSAYLFSKIPNQVDWSWVVPIVIFAVVAAMVGALIPAYIAARSRPITYLRYE